MDRERHKQSLTEDMKEGKRMLVKYRILKRKTHAGREGIGPLRIKENG